MQFDAATIERMVRDVLNQLQPSGKQSSQPTGQAMLLSVPSVASVPLVPSVKQENTTIAPQPVAIAQLVLGDRIITADLLKEKTQPGSQIVIASKSIITPAAHDYIRTNRIGWERGTVGKASASTSVSAAHWRIVVSSASDPVKKAIDAICQQRTQVKQELVGTATEAARMVVSAMSRAEVPGIVVITTAPHLVACRVNRNLAIRAAVVADLKSLNAAQATLHPNVVCIDPTERSFMELQNILNKIVSSQVPAALAGWDEN